ncbi:MAG TPA: metallophosphoesterase family protein [Solirubrobacteraceae bacterium]|nr:metallophosphoesterase family protein [Solirubrobacteraceae bacterium]
MLALLYDIHGNVRGLDAVLEDAAQQGADAYFIGGDVALFGPWPEATVARLRELQPATWIRGNGERWTANREDAPEFLRGATDATRNALGDELVAEHAALPGSAAVADGTRAWHGSPVSDVRSFTPEPGDDEAELLAGVEESRLIFGHTHLPFARMASNDGRPVELVNPGSVGMPLDGDHRAAYALLREDGTIEHRRVAYDHHAVIAELRDRFGETSWHDRVAHRFTHARMETATKPS